ncbi:MAG: hybrid sensor histidine kinase/response regulator [Arcobacteraceae bacterium]|nr:hybrid sensor histidine kinase/response regulator [Arcobacteraceae bacterium]
MNKKYSRLKELVVLYVEDEIDVSEEIEDMLSLKVKKLYKAYNGQEGLNIYNKYSDIDVIITDIKMPIMDGIEMISKVRQSNETIPIIVTTAFNETSFLKKAIDLHVDKYIIKPIDMLQLFAVLNRASEVIFQRKELEQKDIMLKNREKIYAMGELIENIAHQWRQPLSVISTAASGIKLQKEYGTLNDEFLLEACDYINDNTQKLSDTINQFREFFHNDELAKEFNLKEIILDCYNIVKDSYSEKSINLVLDINDCIIYGVKNNYIQIILTILANSKDILIEHNNDIKQKYIFIELKNNLLSIKDNAGGIEKENISKVFEPYFTTKHKSHGTGLGLYIVHKIVTKYLNASIEVQNVEYEYNKKVYKGAEFRILF